MYKYSLFKERLQNSEEHYKKTLDENISLYNDNCLIFSLYAIFELLNFERKNYTVPFVDFEKVFNLIHRIFLQCKHLENNIKWNCFNHTEYVSRYKVLHNRQWWKIKFLYLWNGRMPCENIYPFLFAIFLNDLRKYFEEIDLDGVKSITSDLEYVLTIS